MRTLNALFQIILIIVLLRLLWRIIRPYFLKMQPNADIRGTSPKPDSSIKIDESQIEDAKFREIEESKDDSKK